MRVHVNGRWWDVYEGPIVIELADFERDQIAKMPPKPGGHGYYMQYQNAMTEEAASKHLADLGIGSTNDCRSDSGNRPPDHRSGPGP